MANCCCKPAWFLHHSPLIRLKIRKGRLNIKRKPNGGITHTFLGLLAKIKCSICSYQFNI
ncbi:hypothetical protein Lal_00039015 [Lupinus albus]|nr:hypothetical protein Lal_00039015 [Lupinus albus]